VNWEANNNECKAFPQAIYDFVKNYWKESGNLVSDFWSEV